MIYRRWADRDELVGAALAYQLGRDRIATPDTGSLRGDVIEVMRRANEARSRLIPMLSVLVGSYFTAGGVSFAELRARVFDNQPRGAFDEILDRAVARGEADPRRITARVRTVAFDLFRHDLLMTLQPLPDEAIVDIVDQVFLPLVRPVSSK